MLPYLLAAIQNSTHHTKYIVETKASIKFDAVIFYRVTWAFGPCIAA
jgi:hypothetical protein